VLIWFERFNLTQNGIFRFIMPRIDAPAGVSEPLVATLPRALKPRHSYSGPSFPQLGMLPQSRPSFLVTLALPPPATTQFSRKYFTLTRNIGPLPTGLSPPPGSSFLIVPQFNASPLGCNPAGCKPEKTGKSAKNGKPGKLSCSGFSSAP
jgi:hypothetical protein